MEYGQGSGPSVWGRIPAEHDRCGVVFPRFGAGGRPYSMESEAWDYPTHRGYSHEAAQECAIDIVTDAQFSWGVAAETLLSPEFWPAPEYLAAAFEAALEDDVGCLVRSGWTPADLAVVVDRATADAGCVAVLATALHVEAVRRKDVWLPPGWTAAIERLGRRAAVNGLSVPGLRAIIDIRRSFLDLRGLADATEDLDWLARRSEDAELADTLTLLDRAETAGTDAEADALTGRAQTSLGLRSARCLSASALPPPVHVRRIWLSEGYVKPQESMLTSLAGANGCGLVFTRARTLATLVGTPWDLDAVEALHASLLVQATAGRSRRAEQFRDARRPGSTVPLPPGPPFMAGYPGRVHDVLVAAADATESAPAQAVRALADQVAARLALLPSSVDRYWPPDAGLGNYGDHRRPGPYRPGCA